MLLYQGGGRSSVTVKNTFIDFEPVRSAGLGLRTVHTAGGRLDLLSEEYETMDQEQESMY